MPVTPVRKKGTCLKCQIPIEAILIRMFTVSGSEVFLWSCPFCEKRNPFGGKQMFISKVTICEHLTKDQIDSLPVQMPDCSVRCVRCGAREAELHHWAPRAIFGDKDCEKWPKDYLCRDCHKFWHKMVTPQLVLDDK